MIRPGSFAREDLSRDLTIQKWNPPFGMLADLSSLTPPPELAASF